MESSIDPALSEGVAENPGSGPASEPEGDAGGAAAAAAAGGLDKAALRDKLVAALKECYDPEIPVDIWELGLIYEVNIDDDANVEVKMTLTSPACPAAGELPPEVEHRTGAVEGVASSRVEVVWEPPWTPDLMSAVAWVEHNMW